MRLAHDPALLLLAATPATDEAALDLKAAFFVDYQPMLEADGHFADMAAAALAADVARLRPANPSYSLGPRLD